MLCFVFNQRIISCRVKFLRNNANCAKSNLKIPVNNCLSVQVVDRANDFCSVEPWPILRENSFSLQVEVQLAAVHVLRHQTQPVGGRERVAKGKKKRMVYSLKKKTRKAH